MRIGGQRLWRWLGGTVAFVLIGAAVMLTVLRLALPFAADYRAALEDRVADYLDTPVSIGSMEVEWHGLGPRLRLVDLRLQGPPPARRPLYFDEAFVDIGLGPGLGDDLPVFIRSMSLVGLNLEIALDEDGQLAMLGERVPVEKVIPKGETPPPFVRRIGGWLLGTERLQLLDASIDLVSADGDRSRISGIDLRLANDGDHHRASLSMQLPPEWGDSIEAVFDVNGAEIGDWAQWDGRVWVDADGLALRRWSGLYPELPIHVRDGRASFATWIGFGDGRLQEVALQGGGDDLAVAGGPMEASAAFERIAGRFHWQSGPDGDWQADVGDLEVRRGGRAWPTSGLSVARETTDGGARWRVGADFLRIDDTLALARLTPWADELPPKLRPLAPTGDLYDLQAAGAPSEPIALRARFEDMGWIAAGEIPGVSGVDGRLTADDGARIELAARDASVDAPRFMAAPLAFDRFSGRVDVAWPDEGLRIRGEDLRAENADGTANGRVEAFVPGDGRVLLDVEAGFDDVPVPAVTRYIPARKIPDEVMEYLDRTLQDGRVDHGELRLKGAARDFPYRDGEGTFTVDIAARDARVAFAPDWPALEQVTGRVRFDGPSMRIDADAARLFGIRSRRLTASIPDLEEGRLTVSAEADAPIPDLIRLVKESPLEDELGGLFEGARGGGEAPFDLDLEVPVRAPEQTTVSGRLAFSGDSLVQPRFDLDMRDLDGELRFTRRGVEMDGLGATVRGQRLSVDARVEDGPDPDNLIEANGTMEPDALLPHLSDALDGHVAGAAPWRINIRIPSTDDAPIVLSGDSELRGTEIDLPSPLRKARDEDRRLAFSVPLESDDEARVVRLEYGDDLRALVELLEDGDGGLVCDRAAVRFGGGEPRLREEPGLYLAGALERLDLRGWARMVLAAAGADGSSSEPAGSADADGLSAAPGFGGADLDIESAGYAGYVFSEAQLRARRDGEDWLLDLNSDEARGQTRIPANVGAGEPIRVRYDSIDLGLLAPEADTEPTAMASAGEGGDDGGGLDAVDPASVPPLDVRIGRLKTRNALLNDVALVTSPSSEGVTIHRLGFNNDNLRLEGQGRWSDDPSRTSLRLQLRSGNFGAGLSGIGYGGALVEGEGEVTANLDWNGPPWEPTLEGLGGYAQLQLKDGLIPEVDPGPARLLGLVSLRALPQLLSMDFGNLVQRGYAFDTIGGRIDFDEGNAFSRGLEVDGPAGKMIITGRTGLVARDYDQTVAFQPELSSSLPVIGALTGGPVTGLAIALVQGVLRNIGADVEKATEFRYSLTGTWADPKVQLVNRTPENTNTYDEPSRPGRQGR